MFSQRRSASLSLVLGLVLLALNGNAQVTAVVNPGLVLVDNFQGWGTSLCWWGNVVGGYANRNTYATMAFSQLKLNIVRYNIGGGENPNIVNTMQFRARMAGFEPTNGVWNWNADANQRWMLQQAVALGANQVVAFANSPPWWMTVSGSVTGSTNGSSNNLQTGFENSFANYLAIVVSNLTVLDGIKFDLVTPVNESTASWWVYGGSQEGCHISADQQARVVTDLHAALISQKSAAGIDASEDNDEQSTINAINTYGSAASNVTVIASHTYGANNATGLRNLAVTTLKPAWVSEYGDGDASGMTMARRIRDDLTGIWVRAWIYWQFVDNAGGWGMLNNALDGSGNTSYVINKKFYVMGQFSEFIRPGFQIINIGDSNSLAAFNPTNRTLVIVTVNDSTNSYNLTCDLSAFSGLPASVTRYRTSASENLVNLGLTSVAGQQFISAINPQSVTTHVLANVTFAAASAPAAWYPLEGSAQDASGNGNNGTGSGVTYVAGKLGAQAAQFNGTSSYLQIPRSISNNFTIAFWLKTTATAGTGQWWAGKGLVDGEVAGATNDFGVALIGSQAAFGVGNADTTISSTSAVNDGQWHHVAATRDNTTGEMQLYVDGLLQAAAFGPTGTRNAPPSLRVGSIQTGSSGGFFAGAIDDVQLFTRVFRSAEIASLMNHPPAFANAPGNFILLAGRTLMATNSAVDPDLPAQTLSWSLQNPPTGAAINATNGLFSWRPAMAQAPATNTILVIVSDNGSPSMSATQSFAVTVQLPQAPTLSPLPITNGNFLLSVTGDAGPDYILQTRTNLAATAGWLPVFTNASATPPFQWNTASAAAGQRFFRVQLAP
jgi:hypothetical protein